MKRTAYPKYPEYGALEADWLGTLPIHWSFRRLRFIALEPLMYGANEAAVLEDREFPRYIRITDVKEDGTLHEDTFRSLEEDVAAPYLLQDGDILLARSGATVGKSFQYLASWGRAAYAGYLIRFRPDQSVIFPRFANYYFQTACYWACINSTLIQATIENFSAEKYKDLNLPLPAHGEQVKIAAFLDWKTRQIEALIARKLELLEKLKEKRSTVVTQAVTQGLDPTVPMRDSGTPWLGKVPEHWHVMRLKDYGRLVGGAGFPIDEQGLTEEELPFYKVGDLKEAADGRNMAEAPNTISRETASKLSAKIIPADAVVYAKIGAALLLNRRRITSVPCCIDNNMTAYIPDPAHLEIRWVHYWLSVLDFGEFVNPGAVPSLSEGYQSVIPIFVPEPTEQKTIADFLDAALPKMDQLVDATKRTIERLAEYRIALITAATTGKIDVRNVGIPQPVE